MKKAHWKLLKWIGIAILAGIVSVFLLIAATYFGLFGSLPDKAEILQIKNEEASLVLTSDNVIIGKYFAENRTNIAWDDLPDYLVNAVISTEDKRFYQHHGIDKKSYLRVLVRTIMLGDQSSGGGSTITQQLAKNIYGRANFGILTLPISKIKEAILAKRFESVFSKNEILLLYLNSVPFGENVYGIEAAANRYFNKTTSELSVQEAATLIGMLKANTYYNPRLNPENALSRRNTVLQLMRENGYFTEVQADSICLLSLELHYSNLDSDAGYGYFVAQVKKKAANILNAVNKEDGTAYDIEKDGLRIITTLDSRLQELARKSVAGHLEKMQKLLNKELTRRKLKKSWQAEQEKKSKNKAALNQTAPREVFEWSGDTVVEMTVLDSLWHYYKMLNAAVLIAEPSSGAVLTWVGGNDYQYLPFDLVLSHRQAASTIKPLIYAAALEEGLEPCSYLDNSKTEYKNFKDWNPSNYDNSTSEDVDIAMWYALAHSVNLPTVDLYFKTGYENVRDLLNNAGLDAPLLETPAIALGALDVSLYQMVKAYCAFANKGSIPADLQIISEITDASGNIIYKNKAAPSTQVFSVLTADEITAILERAVDSGTGASLRSRYRISAELAGKTGTAQNYSDAWFISYTPGIVIGAWVGAMSPQLHFQSGLGSGSALALPICGTIVRQVESTPALNHKYLVPFLIPEDVYAQLDCDPFRQKGIKSLFEWLNIKDKNSPKPKAPKQPSKKKKNDTVSEEKGIKKFFKNLFGKKDKK